MVERNLAKVDVVGSNPISRSIPPDRDLVSPGVECAAGGSAGKGMTVTDIQDFIRGVGLRPILRDTVYNEIETVS